MADKTLDLISEKAEPEALDWFWFIDNADGLLRKAQRPFARVLKANTTIDVASSGGDFTTVGAALASLADAVFEADVTVTIAVAAETFVESQIDLNHPQGRQIHVTGASAATTTLSFSADAEHGIVADGCTINIDQVTILSTSTTKYGVHATNGGRVHLGSDVIIDGWGEGVRAEKAGFVSCDGLDVVDSTSRGIHALGSGAVSGSGVTVSQSAVNGDVGVRAVEGAVATLPNLTVSGASRTGPCVFAGDGARVVVTSADIDDGTYGLYSQNNAAVVAYGANVNSASTHNVYAQNGGQIDIRTGTSTNSTGWGCFAADGSLIVVGGSFTTSGHGSGNYSPTPGADGNNNSRIVT